MTIASLVFALLAGLLHVFIFTMESVTWSRPETWKRFGVASQSDADTNKSMAFNQGFYNLFLAIGALAGIAFVAAGQSQIGWTLVFSSCGSMLLASLVLVSGGSKYLRPAAIQGTTPLLAVVLGILAVTLG